MVLRLKPEFAVYSPEYGEYSQHKSLRTAVKAAQLVVDNFSTPKIYMMLDMNIKAKKPPKVKKLKFPTQAEFDKWYKTIPVEMQNLLDRALDKDDIEYYI
jgi:hypothetical protein